MMWIITGLFTALLWVTVLKVIADWVSEDIDGKKKSARVWGRVWFGLYLFSLMLYLAVPI